MMKRKMKISKRQETTSIVEKEQDKKTIWQNVKFETYNCFKKEHV